MLSLMLSISKEANKANKVEKETEKRLKKASVVAAKEVVKRK